MTRGGKGRGGNPSVKQAETALTSERLATGRPEPRGSQDPGKCTVCGKTVDPLVKVSHGLRGPHTCKDISGQVAYYVDPSTPEEKASAQAYYRAEVDNRAAIREATHGTP